MPDRLPNNDQLTQSPWHYLLQSLLIADSLAVRLQIVQDNYTILVGHDMTEVLHREIEALLSAGMEGRAAELWRINVLLHRVRNMGIAATFELMSQPTSNETDDMILLERSKNPFAVARGVQDLLQALSTRDTEQILNVLAAHKDPLCDPAAIAMLRYTESLSSTSGTSSAVNIDHAIELLEIFRDNRDFRPFIAKWWPQTEVILKDLGEHARVAMEYSSSKSWADAYSYLRAHQTVLFSKPAMDHLRIAFRATYQTGELSIADLLWRRLRVLEWSRHEGIDATFARLVWNPNAEQIWQSRREQAFMEAAAVSIDDMEGLIFLLLAIESDNEREIDEYVRANIQYLREPWVANYARYMAEIANMDGDGTANTWESMADFLDQLRTHVAML